MAGLGAAPAALRGAGLLVRLTILQHLSQSGFEPGAFVGRQAGHCEEEAVDQILKGLRRRRQGRALDSGDFAAGLFDRNDSSHEIDQNVLKHGRERRPGERGSESVKRIVEVAGFALIYLESTIDDYDVFEKPCRDAGLQIPLNANIIDVEQDSDMLNPLFTQARELCDGAQRPPGRASCPDCRQFRVLLETMMSTSSACTMTEPGHARDQSSAR